MGNNKKTYLIIGIFAIIFTFFGGSLAYWQWTTSTEQQTAVNFTIEDNFSCSVDGGGNVSSTDKMLAPASCMNEKYAIQRTITASADITGIDTNVSMDLWLDVKSIDPELSQSANFKYALTSNSSSCTEDVLESGTFTGKSANSTALILDDKIFTASGSETYYLYIWLDSVEENQNTMDKNFNLELNGNCVNISVVETTYTESILNGADPVLETGMIPVVISDNGDVTTADLNSEWYNYEDKQWANAILVNSTSRVNYYESDMITIKANELVNKEDILAYYVWIPRYKYKVWLMDGTTTSSPQTIDIIFENSETDKSVAMRVGEYYTHPAFTFGDKELNGIWVGKFETTGTGDNPTILPDVESLTGESYRGWEEWSLMSFEEKNSGIITSFYSTNKSNMMNYFLAYDDSLDTLSDYFEVSLKFAGGTLNTSTGDVSFTGNDIYGLTANTDSHMMKNSEWGAVAYLSHSNYGINSEIYVNNSERYYTGRSGGNVGGSVNTPAVQFSNSTLDSTNQYNDYGYYTWLGQPISSDGTIGEITDSTLGTKASTTGNVTGIYDMSGGSYEYVMSNYNNQIGDSGFTIMPVSKYYDLYLGEIFMGDYTTNTTLCTLATCGGYALNETSSWYNDAVRFVDSDHTWFTRGGRRDGIDVGIFDLNFETGYLFSYISFRSVAVKRT